MGASEEIVESRQLFHDCDGLSVGQHHGCRIARQLVEGILPSTSCRFPRLSCAVWPVIRNRSGGVKKFFRSGHITPVTAWTPTINTSWADNGECNDHSSSIADRPKPRHGANPSQNATIESIYCAAASGDSAGSVMLSWRVVRTVDFLASIGLNPTPCACDLRRATQMSSNSTSV
jgi:hypothetical protein